jgi:competence protein ComFC
MKNLIHGFKYDSRLHLSEVLSDLFSAFLCDNHSLLDGVDRVTFVPMAQKRLRKRGFNQSLVLAKGVAESYGIPMDDCMEKYRPTKNQNELSRDDRLVNLRGAFRVKDASDISGRTVLIIDDVMTTGATLNECARALLDAGASEVRGITLARGI